MLDLARRGLLPSRARWSGSRFGFCDDAQPLRWVGQPGVSRASFHLVRVRVDPTPTLSLTLSLSLSLSLSLTLSLSLSLTLTLPR